MSAVAAAGPVANVVMALVAGVVARALDLAGVEGFAADAAYYAALFNFALAILNLLPVPPLDGYNIVVPLLPARIAWQVQAYAQYGVMILLGLVVLSYALPGPGPLTFIFSLARLLADLVTGA